MDRLLTISSTVALLLAVAVEFIVLLLHVRGTLKAWKLTKTTKRAQDYRIYPDRNRWNRTEIIAVAGLLVAIVGLAIALFR